MKRKKQKSESKRRRKLSYRVDDFGERVSFLTNRNRSADHVRDLLSEERSGVDKGREYRVDGCGIHL